MNQLLESDPTLLPDFISGQVAAVVGEIPRPKHNDMRVDASDEDGQKFCGLENLQTLCSACHADKTAAEQRARKAAESPALQRKLPSQGKVLVMDLD